MSVIVGLAYTFVFRSVYYSYISVDWSYTGLTYRDLGILEILFIYIAVSIVSWFMPTRFIKPSVVILWSFYAAIFVPTISIALMTGYLSYAYYIPALSAFSLGMIGLCWLCRSNPDVERPEKFRVSLEFSGAILALYLLLSAILLYFYWDILSFSGIDEVYVQRFSAADVTFGLMGYLGSHYGYFFSPLIMVIGLLDRDKWYFLPIALFGFLLSYMIDASKISLIIPITMMISAVIFRFNGVRVYHLTGGMVAICVVSFLLTDYVGVVRFLADLVLLRTISIPALTFTQYFDVFYFRGFTWWSHISGISLIVPPPAAFRHDPFWPAVGQLVGAEYYGFMSRTNLNANPFVGEGIAAAGAVGIVVISIFLGGFLWLLDRLTRRWNLRALLVLMFPIGFALTNVHLSTYLVSFGGAAWLALFAMARQRVRRIGGKAVLEIVLLDPFDPSTRFRRRKALTR